MTRLEVLRRIGAAAAATCLWSAAAEGAGEQGRFAIKGIGIQNCAQFRPAYEERSQAAFVFAGWVDGYVSALNRLQAGTFDAAPWQSTDILLALINNHCANNPEARLHEVVRALLTFYAEQQLADISPPVEAVVGERKVTLYQEVLRRAQLALAEQGVYAGAADGVFGPKTQAAFEAFQEKLNLAKTGLPDQQTLYRLFSPAPAPAPAPAPTGAQ